MNGSLASRPRLRPAPRSSSQHQLLIIMEAEVNLFEVEVVASPPNGELDVANSEAASMGISEATKRKNKMA